MTRRTDRYSTTEIEGEEGGSPFPTADKIFPQGEPPKLGIPRINAAKIQSENEALKGQLAQLQEMINTRPSNALDVQTSTFTVGECLITPTGLQAPENFTFEDWEQIGHLIFRLDGAIQWLIGDWLVYGADLQYGDLTQIAEATGRDVQTFYHVMSTCRKVENCRRRQDVSFAHHSEVKAKTPEIQDYALDFAAQHRFNVKQFRQWIKLGMPEEGLPEAAAPALPAGEHSSRKAVIGQFDKFFDRDPAKAKPEERQQAVSIYEQMAAALEEYRQKWGI